MTISASSGGVPAAKNNARPISLRRSAGIFGIVLPPSMGRAKSGGVDLQSIETLRVVEEDLALQLDRHVVAIGEGRHRIRELAVPVGIVGCKQDVVGGEEVGHIAQGLLLRLAGYEHPAASHVFRRLGLQQRCVETRGIHTPRPYAPSRTGPTRCRLRE